MSARSSRIAAVGLVRTSKLSTVAFGSLRMWMMGRRDMPRAERMKRQVCGSRGGLWDRGQSGRLRWLGNVAMELGLPSGSWEPEDLKLVSGCSLHVSEESYN